MKTKILLLKNNFKILLRALKYRNFRLFYMGQGVSLIGTWIQQVALSWLVYRLSNSSFILGIVSFSSQMPSFLLSPFAGVLADRWNKHKIIIITQSLAMLQAVILAILVLTNTAAVWNIVCLSAFLGLINAFDITVRQSFVVELIEKREDLSNAIALNSALFNSARLIGPAIAGILISAAGEGPCFVINAVSFISVLIALLLMQVKPHRNEKKVISIFQEIQDGFHYAYKFKPIRYLLFFLGTSSLLSMFHMVLMPVFARDILHGKANTLGFLMSSIGVGALFGAVYLASRKSVIGLEKIIALTITTMGISMILFSFSRNLWLSMIILLFIAFSVMVQMAASNTLLQTIVDDDKRGRIMSLYAMAFMGTAPFGSLLAGSLAHKIGTPHTIAISGICSLFTAALFIKKLPVFHNLMKPIYIHRGIIKEIISDNTLQG